MVPIAVSRRRLLVAAVWASGGLGVAGLTGCTAASPGAPAIAGDDVDLARRAATEAAALAAGLEAAARRHRSLRPLLGPLADRHIEHARVFTPDGEQPPTPDPGPARVARSPGAALRALVDTQRQAAASTRRAALAAASGDLASALASAAACMAQHVQRLSVAADEGGGSP